MRAHFPEQLLVIKPILKWYLSRLNYSSSHAQFAGMVSFRDLIQMFWRASLIFFMWEFPRGGGRQDLPTDVLSRRSHCSRSPNGTYSITRNFFSYMVQHPTKDTIFWCEPNSFICSISCENSSLCLALGLSRHKVRSKSFNSQMQTFHWTRTPYESIIETCVITTISNKSLPYIT